MLDDEVYKYPNQFTPGSGFSKWIQVLNKSQVNLETLHFVDCLIRNDGTHINEVKMEVAESL